MMKSINLAVKTLKTLVNSTFILAVSIEFSAPALAEPILGEHITNNVQEDYFGGTGQTEAPKRNGSGTYCIENPDLTIHPCWETQTDEEPENQTEDNLEHDWKFDVDEDRSCNRSPAGSRYSVSHCHEVQNL